MNRIKQQAELERITEEESSIISPKEEAWIRAGVRAVMNQKFVAGRTKLESNPFLQNPVKFGTETSDTEVIDLMTPSATSLQKSQPTVILGSSVSLASTPSNIGNGGNAPRISYLSQETVVASAPQMFATMHWKPKEPPCFFGCGMEDVHTWTSLVRHYLTFMGGIDA